MAEITIPRPWTSLGVGGLSGTVIIIGASDTGKSTLARYLYQQLCRKGGYPAYLDLDMGQSTLGLPTTMNLALPAGGDRFPPQGARYAYFTGSITPRGHMLPTVIGAHRLQQKALKQWKIELLAPSTVIGLQREGELEPILWPLRRDSRVRCVELAVSPQVVRRVRETRIERRHELLARYLEAARPRTISLRQTVVYNVERLASSALLAFQDREGFALGLGVVEGIDRRGGTIIVRTPLPSMDGVASVRFGAARWSPARVSQL